MMKTRILSIVTLLLMAAMGATAQTYNVTVQEGVEEADKWSATPNPAEGGQTVTIKYNGTKKVKSVKAVKKAAAAPTDLSMVDCAGAARTAMSTANCYMVHTAGAYKLPLVYGNAIKNGAANSAAWTGVAGNNTTATFPNHAGTAINAPWITKAATGEGVDKGMGIAVDKAELLWQDAEGLITAVGIDGDYLTLTVGKDAATQEGNAVIAAKSGDDIVWSWHIWVTKESFADATLTTVTTGTGTQGINFQIYKVTPVNLGWVGERVSNGTNTFYQWGRKDPFPGTGEVTSAAGGASASIADHIKNPATFYTNAGSPCSTTYYNMWDAQNTATGNVITATKKTVYDPCPPGFCVPTGNLYYYMAGGENKDDSNWDDNNKGQTFNNIFFHASGFRSEGSGTLYGVGSDGFCWSASPSSSYNGHYLYFSSGHWYWDGNNYRAYGFPVRAVAE